MKLTQLVAVLLFLSLFTAALPSFADEEKSSAEDETVYRTAQGESADEADDDDWDEEPVEVVNVDAAKPRPYIDWMKEAYPVIERAIVMQTARTTRKFHFELIIDHRANRPLTENSFHDLLGLDRGALKIGLGLRCGLWDHLDVGVYRLNGVAEIYDTYELDAKYEFLNQEDHYISAALRAGGTLFSQYRHDDASGYFGQFLLSGEIIDRIFIGGGAFYHSESSNDFKTTVDDAYTVALGANLQIRPVSFMAFSFEGFFPVYGYASKYPSLSGALKIITNRHAFSLVVSNTPYTSADSVITGTNREYDEVIFGFTLTREIEI